MTKQLKSIADLIPDAENLNLGTERGLRMLDDSLRKYGAGRSILADRNGVVLAGNKTLEKAADIGLPIRVVETDGKELVVVQRRDLDLATDPNARALAIADNRVSEVDYVLDLPRFLAMAQEQPQLTEGMYSEAEMQALVELAARNPEGEREAGAGGDEFNTEPLEGETRCKRGDVWQLGEQHRLLVDDGTVDENIARLLGTEKAHAVVTDPPYAFGLSSTSALSSKSGGWHDMMNNASWFKDRYNQWRQMVGRGPLWVFCNWRTLPILMRASFDSKVGIESVMVWYKDWIGPGGMRGLRPTYEFIALSVLGDYGLVDRGIEDFYTAKWSSHKPTGHQAEKPVDLLTHLLTISHCPNIFDPFCGSGTTLIAAHRLGYRCFGAELSESWADVILRRFTAETGLEPELISREE